MVRKTVIRLVQQSLTDTGYDPGPVDGVYGQQTLDALSQVAAIPPGFTKTRKLIAFLQIHAHNNNLDCGPVDGYWGPLTEYAYEQLQHLASHNQPLPQWRPDTHPTNNPHGWPDPATDQAILDFYGDPATQQVMLQLPFPMKLAWDTGVKVTRLQCHQLVHDSLGRVLAQVEQSYGLTEIKRLRLDRFGGCFNHRNMRGSDRLSKHSWGIALDFDPDKNKLRWGSDKAAFAQPEYGQWWQAWEDEGWVSLGRTRNFDWMHVQATA